MSWILKYSLAVGFALKKQNVFVRLWILTILPRINQIEKIMARPIGDPPPRVVWGRCRSFSQRNGKRKAGFKRRKRSCP